MVLQTLPYDLSVCQTASEAALSGMNGKDFYCAAKTDEEYSLVCLTADVPAGAIRREDGWKAFRIQGVLDFSLIGILARISAVLAEQNIGIFVVSTFNTDYVLVKATQFAKALQALRDAGYTVV